MTDSVEQLLRQMSLKKPSQDLDERIAELIVERRLQMQLDAKKSARWSWLSLLGTAASFLALGLTTGVLIAGKLQIDDTTDQISSQNVGNAADSEEQDTGTDSVETEPAQFESVEGRTRFVDDGRLVRNADGELVRAYRTLTPRRYLLYDTETKSFYDLEVELPRVVVTSPPEI